MEITVIGASGKIGSQLSFLLAREKYIRNINLVAREKSLNMLEGVKMDIYDALAASGRDAEIRIHSDTEIENLCNSDMIIITSGAKRNGNMSRLDLAKTNAKIIKNYSQEIAKHCDTKIFMVSNPVDVMTYKALMESGYDKSKVFGLGTHLDSMRFKVAIAKFFKVHIDDVRARIVGEHGDSMVPLISSAAIGGIPVRRLPNYENFPYYDILNSIKTHGKRINGLKNGSEYGPASAIVNIVKCMANNDRRILTLSTYLEDEIEGIEGNACVGVPVKVGKKGIDEIIPIKMEDWEYEAFKKSVDVLRGYCKSVSDI
ncbi:malate dehydrogenase [Methanococcus voltae]|uniref:Malate dehydrogenase (NADP(+)) n=1 Tax=Methanococcus voltae (strain ATCC BAA-1334 / A3) TaxID=456320 RepID=D7DTV0_METV3|nr:malate dehydrogenase [Methanococcus voltae]MCS3900358.1 malate dehydrogenase [Methanococcus voltae]